MCAGRDLRFGNLYFFYEIKRWQEYTEELYKKDHNDQNNHDCGVTHLEPYILECEVKWVLGSITMSKASEVMKFKRAI